MGYKFPFAGLLKYRKSQEEVCRREFFAAQTEVEKALENIRGMYDSRDRARHEAEQLSRRGGQTSMQLQGIADYIEGLNLKIDRERSRARDLMQIADDKRDILVAAARETKVLEKLEEKRPQAYRDTQKKIEEKRTQDLVTMRFARGEKS